MPGPAIFHCPWPPRRSYPPAQTVSSAVVGSLRSPFLSFDRDIFPILPLVGEINFAKFQSSERVARFSSGEFAAPSRVCDRSRFGRFGDSRRNLTQLSRSRFDEAKPIPARSRWTRHRDRAFPSRFISREIEITGGFRYCPVNHNSRSFIQFRLLACMRAAWNRRSPPEISPRVADCPRKITGSYVYSICRVADVVLSRACPDNMRSDSPPCAANPRARTPNRRHFNQCRGRSDIEEKKEIFLRTKSHPFNRPLIFLFLALVLRAIRYFHFDTSIRVSILILR